MWKRIAVLGCLAWASAVGVAQADAFSIAGAFKTSGVFRCYGEVTCSGEGTNTVTLGSGDNMATLTFVGVERTLDITNVAHTVNLGRFESTGSPEFTFPERINPNIRTLGFLLTIEHTAPLAETRQLAWFFGPGGASTIRFLMGPTYTSFDLPPNAPPFNYWGFIYSFKPVPPSISGFGTTDLNADVGAVPEPATLLLVGAGLAGAFARRRSRFGVTRALGQGSGD
jgi:hypothetical protein